MNAASKWMNAVGSFTKNVSVVPIHKNFVLDVIVDMHCKGALVSCVKMVEWRLMVMRNVPFVRMC